MGHFPPPPPPVQIVMLLIMRCPPVSSYFLPLTPKCLPTALYFWTPSDCVFPLIWETKFCTHIKQQAKLCFHIHEPLHFHVADGKKKIMSQFLVGIHWIYSNRNCFMHAILIGSAFPNLNICRRLTVYLYLIILSCILPMNWHFLSSTHVFAL
jgi:hypothetical protein